MVDQTLCGVDRVLVRGEAAGEDAVLSRVSQPRTSTVSPFSEFQYSTPCAKPSMKIETVGKFIPPNVPTFLAVEYEADA
jgi:hypothetical protein